MKLAPLLLSTLLVFGSGLGATALAHDGGHGYGHGKWSHKYDAPRRHWLHGHHHHRGHHWKKGHWRGRHFSNKHRYWRPRHGSDSWYGFHLFFGGH